MDGQNAVRGHQPKPLDLALGEQQPVERIARVRLGVNHRENMRRLDGQKLNIGDEKSGWNFQDRTPQRELAEPTLDCDLLQARHAGTKIVGACFNSRVQSARQ